MSSKKETELGRERSDFSVSPDGGLVAYLDKSSVAERLVIGNALTGDLLELPVAENWWSLADWANNHELIIQLAGDHFPHPEILFDPFTKSTSSLPDDFPDQQQLLESSTTRLPAPAYDPTMDYVVYPAAHGDEFGLALLRRSTNRRIAFFPNQTFVDLVTAPPQWNHAGTEFIFNSTPLQDTDPSVQYTDELHLGSLDGSAKQLTKLSTQVERYNIGYMLWSPDDRYVAFMVWADFTPKLMLLDTRDREILDVCINAGVSYPQDMVWAPDSTQLLVANQNDTTILTLVDLSNLQAGTLPTKAHYYLILGWSAPAH